MSGANGNVIMSRWKDDDPDDQIEIAKFKIYADAAHRLDLRNDWPSELIRGTVSHHVEGQSGIAHACGRPRD